MPSEQSFLRDVQIQRLAADQAHYLPQLAESYFQGWNKEGLCPSLDEALNRVSRYDPDQAFIVVDSHSQLFSAMFTLPVAESTIPEICANFPTYLSVELSSIRRQKVECPHFRLCFSITSLTGYRVWLPDMEKDISLARFLISQTPLEPGVKKIAYSRWPAVPMHLELGAQVVGVIDNSRPEDKASNGQNVLMLYP